MIDRAAFIARWMVRANEATDPFDQFFCLWVALIILARPLLDTTQQDADYTDRAALVRLSQAHTDTIMDRLGEISAEMRWLAARKGTHRGDPIVDVHDYARHRDHLRTRFQWLAEHYG